MTEPNAKRARIEPPPPSPLDAAIDVALRSLDRHGYAVVEDVVPADECAAAAAGVRAFLAAAGVAVDDPALRVSAWPNSRGIVQHLEAGHADAVWRVRTQPGVARIFERIWGTNDLLVSFDGFCWMPPSYRDNGRQWLHTDQSFHAKKRGRRCIQAYVNLVTSHDERSGSLVVVPGSHELHTAFGQTHRAAATNTADWCGGAPPPTHLTARCRYKMSDAELECYRAAGCGPAVRVHGGVGSVVLWDSRTLHSARAPPADDAPTRERCVVYVCMQPRALCSTANLEKKQRAFNEYRMTTHWPASKVELFPKTWRTWGAPAFAVQTPPRTRVDTPRVLELAGVTPLTTQPLRRSTPGLVFERANE